MNRVKIFLLCLVLCLSIGCSGDKHQDQVSQTEVSQNEVKKASLCGAMTKKKESCKRKVRNGDRCWQHR